MNTTTRPSTLRRDIGDWILHAFVLLAGVALAAPFALVVSAPFLGGW